MKTSIKLLIVAAGAFAAQGAADAHHSRAMYDLKRFVTIEGTVKEWAWSNPHTELVVDVQEAGGKTIEWTLEGASPSFLARYGWKRADIKQGDKVIVKVRPMRDGTIGGSFSEIQVVGGRTLKGNEEYSKPRQRAEADPL